jgi:uncharacterized membrane protein YccC
MATADTAHGSSAETAADAAPAHARSRYAIKTALSLTLAYLVPMSMGWPQPQTAAITVMLITATGLTSDSLQKGVMRVLGTVAGAIIGLSLIALFPQDRMSYLLAASITVSILAYLYNAYQGDSTLFMLAAVVTLMVFNGGDAEGAFQYGVDRAFMTAFGVIVYTVVASTLWPVRAVDNTRALAAGVASAYRRAFSTLVHPVVEGPENTDEQLASLLARETDFQTHFNSIKRYAYSVEAYLAEWNCVVGGYEELQSVLLPALKQETRRGVSFEDYLENYSQVVDQIEAMFAKLEAGWQGQESQETLQPVAVQYRPNSLREAPHLTIAAVVTRAEVLTKIQDILVDLNSALESMLFDRGNFVAGREPRGKPTFIWRDLENVKTAARMFLTFWLATAVWITVNPPLGFTFVALCAVLVLLVSYTPVTPKLLIILFTIGFACALPAYVFLLPHMTHWLELAAFMFTYAFLGFYVFQGPVSIFFMLGLFALGIQNTMSYHFDVILLVVLSFYMLCAMLITTTHFPFTSKPEKLYASLCRRFFKRSARTLDIATNYRGRSRALPSDDGSTQLAKLHTWGAKIDSRYFPANTAQKIRQLTQSCDLLHGQIEVVLMRRKEFADNRLIVASYGPDSPKLLVELCDNLADKNSAAFDRIETTLMGVGDRLDVLRQEKELQNYEREELAQFFIYLNLQHSILSTIRSCYDARQALDWEQLMETRF